MSLIRGTVNPLNVLGIRKLSYLPIHFATMYSNNLKEIQAIDDWIYTFLNSRYCIRKSHKIDNTTNRIVEMCEIGLEDPKELSMLSLGCPYLEKRT